MQRRLNIALALIHSPKILFLDEPQAGLDPQSRVLVRDYIRSIKEKTTIVLTTHDMEEAEKLSDRICIIDKGRLLVTGTADEITRIGGHEDLVEIEFDCDVVQNVIPFLEKELIERITISGNRICYTDKNPLASLEAFMKVVREQKLLVNSLHLRKKSLEDIFINLTGRRIRE
jgi:ABC-2 type transport system ATP-binding protein